jgi:hypothetical protein
MSKRQSYVSSEDGSANYDKNVLSSKLNCYQVICSFHLKFVFLLLDADHFIKILMLCLCPNIHVNGYA